MVALAAVALPCSGCLSDEDLPRDRIGSLPYPGMLTLYATADPARLGPHRYGRWPRVFQPDEKERGIIYTTRAGFLDLAHLRIAADLTRFCTRAVEAAVRDGRATLTLPGPEGDVFHVKLHYPTGWDDLSAAARDRAVDAAAQKVGQRAAYLMVTWHEIATWFGYRTVFLIDESPSAFTWDDSVAHLVGMRVAERAMRDVGRDFDEAVTAELSAELGRLGAVSPDRTDEAVRAVEGRWWAAGRPLKRQFDMYPTEQAVAYPWLVPNPPAWAAGASPETFPLPKVDPASGAAGEVTAEVAIEPRTWAARTMRSLLSSTPEWFADDREVPALMNVMRAQMRARYGPAVNQP